MCGLHRLPYHPYQVVTQSVQICLISQLGGEGFESLGCIVLPSVEAPIYEGLDAPPQWVEQCSYQESGDDYGEWWGYSPLFEDAQLLAGVAAAIVQPTLILGGVFGLTFGHLGQLESAPEGLQFLRHGLLCRLYAPI